MSLSASKLRSDVYRILDEIISTGKPVEVERRGNKLIISPEIPKSKLSKLVKHKCMKCHPDLLIHNDWSGEWKNDLP